MKIFFLAALLAALVSACGRDAEPQTGIAITTLDAVDALRALSKAQDEIRLLQDKLKIIEVEASELRKLKPRLEQAEATISHLKNKNIELEKKLSERMTKLKSMYDSSDMN